MSSLKVIVLVITMCGQNTTDYSREGAGCAVTQIEFSDASSEVALEMCNQAREDLSQQMSRSDSACIAKNFLYSKE